MQVLTFQLVPQTAFGTPLKGDTLFGQLCWAVRNRFGPSRLTDVLQGYTQGRPFAVVSDAFPSGHVPRASLPMAWFEAVDGEDRKAMKKRLWLPLAAMDKPIRQWLRECKTDKEIGEIRTRAQPHNSIDRRTGTTGEGFAPYGMLQDWFPQNARLDCHLVLDESRVSRGDLETLLEDVGQTGFGRDASIGLGKFRIERVQTAPLSAQREANAYFTLAPCAPQGLGFDPVRSFYQPFTRFGRHGDVAVHEGKPFKTPILLAQTGAVLCPRIYTSTAFIGQGSGADGNLSKAIPETVHQGYAPVIGINLPNSMEPAA